ncbi:MAG: protein kinase [Leptolyngbyaceae cyanobacterium CSU_1_3]|nr:protein kinase [Leptolyngbyaceae cyanobacterium CSU_1_3]
MTYCLNPDCKRPQNARGTEFCQSCGSKLIPLLRGRYRIVQPLGQGGFGKTFLSVDEDRLNTRCVIKQFSPQLKGTKALEKAIQLFEQEAVRLHELGEHPHIPTLLAYFEQDKRLYLVQQFIEGPTLAQELNHQGPFSEQKIREVLVRLLPILKFVHDRHVIHRDITPANIIRRKLDNRLVLIDFGVAKLLTEDTSAQPGTKIGTEGYAPVEQLRNGRAYPASDLYSLGATCLYLLTQVKPEDLYDPLSGRWLWREQLAQREAGVSDLVGKILDKLLKDSVNDRYQSADEAMHDLRLALSNPAIASPQKGANPLRAANVTLPPTAGLSGSKPPGSSAAAVPRSNSARSPVSGQPQIRKCLHTLSGHSSWVVSLAISPDGQTLFSGSLDDRIMVWDVGTGERLGTLIGHTKAINSLTTSPDGKMLLSCSDDDSIKLWQLPMGKLVRSILGHSRDVNSVAVSRDGKFFVSGSEDRTICVWRMDTGELLRSFTGLSGMVRSVAVSPNGQILASGGLDNQVKLWNINSGQLVRTLTGHQNSVLSIAISPNGQILASGGKDKTIRLWNPNTGEVIRTLSGHGDIVNSIAISPDGRTLISGSNDKTVKLWNLGTAELMGTLSEHTNAVNVVTISLDNQLFASGSSDNTTKIWQMAV